MNLEPLKLCFRTPINVIPFLFQTVHHNQFSSIWLKLYQQQNSFVWFDYASDYKAERNMLAREVYPRLQQTCAAVGLDFQVVDLRWGVTREATNDHIVEGLCLQEIDECQRLSKGPNFVVKYTSPLKMKHRNSTMPSRLWAWCTEHSTQAPLVCLRLPPSTLTLEPCLAISFCCSAISGTTA